MTKERNGCVFSILLPRPWIFPVGKKDPILWCRNVQLLISVLCLILANIALKGA